MRTVSLLPVEGLEERGTQGRIGDVNYHPITGMKFLIQLLLLKVGAYVLKLFCRSKYLFHDCLSLYGLRYTKMSVYLTTPTRRGLNTQGKPGRRGVDNTITDYVTPRWAYKAG